MQEVQVSGVRSFEQFCRACRLVYQQYYRFGYANPHPSEMRFFLKDLLPVATMFVATKNSEIVSTATAIQASRAGLPSGNTFLAEIQALIDSDRNVVETTKFASRGGSHSAQRGISGFSLAAESIMRALFEWCNTIAADDWIIVVNPKHLPIYVDLYGFEILSESKICHYVSNNPGVLLRLDLEKIRRDSDCLPQEAQGLLCSKRELVQPGPPYQLNLAEASLLLLERPELVSNTSINELEAFRRHYGPETGKLFELIESLGFTEQPPLVSPLKTFSWSKEQNTSGKAALPKRMCFSLRAHLQRLGALIGHDHAEGISQPLIRTMPDVPDKLISDPYALGALLLRLAELMRRAACSGSEIILDLGQPRAVPCILQIRTAPPCIENDTAVSACLAALAGSRYTPNSYHVPVDVAAAGKHSTASRLTLAVHRTSAPALNILVVDDNRVDCKLLSGLLIGAGHSVQIALDGYAACAAVLKQKFDVILMDIKMPFLDGFATAENVRQIEHAKQRRTPIVMVSALPYWAPYRNSSVQQYCARERIDAFLNKPISLPQLENLLKTLTRKWSALGPTNSMAAERV